MRYLIIGLVIGVVVDRYVLPVLDMFLEMLAQWVTKVCTAIQIDTNLMSLEYQEIADKGNQLTPVVGFLADHQDDEEYLDDEDEDRSKPKKIGFIR